MINLERKIKLRMKESAVFGNGMLFFIELSRESSLTFAQRTDRREEKSYVGVWEDISGQENYKCKGPEVEACLAC